MNRPALSFCLAALFAGKITAQATVVFTGTVNPNSGTLQEMVSGGTLTIDGVLFDNWSFAAEFGAPSSTNPASIIVTALGEGTDEVGVRLTPTNGEWSISSPGGSLTGNRDRIGFRVDSSAAAKLLTGAAMELDAVVSGSGISEVWQPDPIFGVGAGATALPANTPTNSTTFGAPVDSHDVNISRVLVTGSNVSFAYSATINSLDATYSLVIPEPSSVLLGSIAFLFVVYRRRRLS